MAGLREVRYMNIQTRNFINNLTEDVIEMYHIDIPISDIDEVVQRLGGAVLINEQLDAFADGSIYKTGDSFKISVSPHQQETRKKFTVAHELGHLFLHMGYRIDGNLWNSQAEKTYFRDGDSEEEYQANEFAAALLMPKNEYKRIMDRYTDGRTVDTSKIAEYFGVSLSAASNRGKFLGYLEW